MQDTSECQSDVHITNDDDYKIDTHVTTTNLFEVFISDII